MKLSIYHEAVYLSNLESAAKQIFCRTVLRANDDIMSHRKNLTVLRAIMSNLHVGCRTALRTAVPMSGVGQNLLHIRGKGIFYFVYIFVFFPKEDPGLQSGKIVFQG